MGKLSHFELTNYMMIEIKVDVFDVKCVRYIVLQALTFLPTLFPNKLTHTHSM